MPEKYENKNKNESMRACSIGCQWRLLQWQECVGIWQLYIYWIYWKKNEFWSFCGKTIQARKYFWPTRLNAIVGTCQWFNASLSNKPRSHHNQTSLWIWNIGVVYNAVGNIINESQVLWLTEISRRTWNRAKIWKIDFPRNSLLCLNHQFKQTLIK